MKDWIDLIAAEVLPSEDAVPKGFRNVVEVAKHRETSISAARRWLKRVMTTGKIKRLELRRRTTRGIARVPYYGPR